MKPTVRSCEPITRSDLRRLRDLAVAEITSFFNRRKDLRRYRAGMTAIALCQGAALHYLNGTNGVKDIDVYFFFASRYNPQLANRRPAVRESGFKKFGVHPYDAAKGYSTRHIDYLRRCIGTTHDPGGGPLHQVQSYLRRGATTTAVELAKKAVIGLWPDQIFGQIVWPTQYRRTGAPSRRKT